MCEDGMGSDSAEKGVSKTKTTEKLMGRSFFARYTAQTLLLDLPLAACLTLTVFTYWLGHVNDAYLDPQLHAMQWTVKRAAQEITYYKRTCDTSDVSTTHASDLFLPTNATRNQAAQHQLLHGVSIFSSVLSAETSANLRRHVQVKSQHLTTAEANTPLIAFENRYTLHLGTEEPSVAKAVQ